MSIVRRKFKCRTPIRQEHRVRSPPLFDENTVNLLATIKESPRDHAEAKRQAGYFYYFLETLPLT